MMTRAAPRRLFWPAQILREAGFAAAALALWLLVLLAPLHQTSRVLVEFRLAGVLPAAAWLLCQPADAGQDTDRPVPICPAHALIGAIGPAPATLAALAPIPVLVAVLRARAGAAPVRPARRRHRQPRGPPPAPGSAIPQVPARCRAAP